MPENENDGTDETAKPALNPDEGAAKGGSGPSEEWIRRNDRIFNAWPDPADYEGCC